MKNSSKTFILLGVTTAAIGISSILQTVAPMNIETIEQKIQAYNHNPDNILDNVFIEDNIRILPFIFENANQTITEATIRSEFKNAGLTVKNISTGSVIGTGTKITVKENSDVYTVLVYGDTNGDGKVDLIDAQKIILHTKNPTTNALKGIYFKAGNVSNSDTIINLIDAQRIVMFKKNLSSKLVVIEPESLKEQDAVISIEMETLPTKTSYNYGETKLDLTGAQIKLNWKSGTNTYITVTDNMIGNYDLSKSGTKTITVAYEGKQTNFEVIVLNKISGIELTENERQNVIEIEEGYQVYTNQNFVLGTIQEVMQENGSKLTQEQLEQLNIEKTVISSIENATEDDLIIKVEIDGQGNILLKGNANKIGSYTVNLSLPYGEEILIVEPITINATRNEELENISLNAIVEDENAIKINNPIQREIIVTNVNDEIINITSDKINFTNVPEGITITKLDADKSPIQETEKVEVRYIEIATTLQTAQEISFNIEVIGSKNIISKEFKFTVKDAPVLNSVEIDAKDISLYIEPQVAENVIAENGNFYTVLPINFFDQAGDKIEVPAANIVIATEDDQNSSTGDIEEGKLKIVLPKVSKKIEIAENTYETKEGNGLYLKFYDKHGNEAKGQTNVAKIGISIMLDEAYKKVDLSSLDGKNVQFILGNQVQSLPIIVNYKKLTNLSISTIGQDNINIDKEGNYVVKLNENFVIGTLEIEEDEGPLIETMLKTKIQTTGSQDGIQISYEKDANGNILVKGYATQKGYYDITPYVEDMVESKNSIIVKVVAVPEIESIQIDNTNLQIGRALTTKITAISNLNPSGEMIKVKDITLDYEKTEIAVKLLDSDKMPIDSSYLEEEVHYLEITTTLETDTNVDLKITLYAGQENEYITTKTIAIYEPIPRAIEIIPTVNLYETEGNVDTVIEEVDGENRIYTLASIQAYADVDKTKPITMTANMLRTGLTTEDKETDKIHITIPTIEVGIQGMEGTRSKAIVDVKYFNSLKISCTTGEIAYIGFAIIPLDETIYTYDKTQINGLEIPFECTSNSEIKKVTTVYPGI